VLLVRYSINVALDGCCDHRAIQADEELHRHATENLDRADALPFGRVTYETMKAAFRRPARTGTDARMEGTLRSDNERGQEVRSVEHSDHVNWNAELVRGDLPKGRSTARAGVGQRSRRCLTRHTANRRTASKYAHPPSEHTVHKATG
jgi:hypothetical protein